MFTSGYRFAVTPPIIDGVSLVVYDVVDPPFVPGLPVLRVG